MNQLPILKKNNFFTKLIHKIKLFFYKEKPLINNSIDLPNNFKKGIKVTVNSAILALKTKLENGEIQAIDLTDSQIDELQKIYNEEILAKQRILEKLKKRVIKPAFFKYILATSVVVSTTAA